MITIESIVRTTPVRSHKLIISFVPGFAGKVEIHHCKLIGTMECPWGRETNFDREPPCGHPPGAPQSSGGHAGNGPPSLHPPRTVGGTMWGGPSGITVPPQMLQGAVAPGATRGALPRALPGALVDALPMGVTSGFCKMGWRQLVGVGGALFGVCRLAPEMSDLELQFCVPHTILHLIVTM